MSPTPDPLTEDWGRGGGGTGVTGGSEGAAWLKELSGVGGKSNQTCLNPSITVSLLNKFRMHEAYLL